MWQKNRSYFILSYLTYLINELLFNVTHSIIENGAIRVSTAKAVSTVTRLFKDDSFTLHTTLYIWCARAAKRLSINDRVTFNEV